MTGGLRGDFAQVAAAQHGVLTRGQAAEIGLTRHRIRVLLRDGFLDEPVPRVLRLRGSVPSWLQRLSIATLAGGDHAVVSHRAGARLHDVDGFTRAPWVEVSIERPRRYQVPGVVAHHVAPLASDDVVVINGLRCTTLARTLADLGAVVNTTDLQRALTDARRRSVDLSTLRATAERLHRPGPTGTGALLRLLDAVPYEGRVPDSWLEELLAMCARDQSIPEAIPQYEIRDDDGLRVAVTDVGLPAVRLGLEGHSRQFHFGPLQEPLDEQRDLRVAACGWELLYLGWHAAHRPADVARLLRSVVDARRRALRL